MIILPLLLNFVSSYIIGIDLGTTFSVVAVHNNQNEVEIIPDDADRRTTPSVVSYYKKSRVVGESAVKLSTICPEETIFAVKRIIGRKFSEEAVQQELRRVPFHIVEREDRPYIKISQSSSSLNNYENGNGNEDLNNNHINKNEDDNYDDDILVSPEEVSALILAKLKRQAEKYLGQTVQAAVITVPAYFNEEQRKATMIAGEIAGLKVPRIISEPTAAALAYGLDKKGDQYVIVYDLGGGTFDVSLLAMEEDYFEVLTTAGDTRLGGEDFDEKCVALIIQRFSENTGRDASRDRVAMARLKKACEKAKIDLSKPSINFTEIYIPLFFDGIDLKINLTIDDFNRINMPLFQKTLTTIEQVLNDANLTKDQINDIVMIGGSTRIPKVRELVSNYFNGKKLCTDINPDEAVAYGAAIQAAVISKENLDLVVVDVYPLTLGVETVGGIMSPIIPRNTRIPVKRSRVYTTHNDDAAGARIEIFEGERKFTRDNRVLGIFELHRLPRAQRGTLQIEVTFEIDANAILTVTAQELTTMTMETIEIDTLDFALSESQVEEAIESAAAFADEDEKDCQRVLARVDYEGTLMELTRTLKAEKGNPMYGKTLYKDLRKKLKERQKWLEDHPMENPEIYTKKAEESREEFAFLFHMGQLPDADL
ncbi:dnaK protein [Tritrichomonas foetus]|uniref:DnaK protein n=1 Tax=Tritrichomonas foetus TaxID=1144522 RepID=A0A1J4KL63_9EUKA|nr:dnaK protein [Tritrichomonas foetus]|eukprot:OHT11882.1 dnaK protein [Tritrichomonas foetus]